MSLSSTIDTADWKVPVEPSDVTLQLKGETRKDARIFRQIATASNRPQSVLELLNSPSHFLPAKMGERFLMLQKKDIRWVEGGKELLPPDDGIDPSATPAALPGLGRLLPADAMRGGFSVRS